MLDAPCPWTFDLPCTTTADTPENVARAKAGATFILWAAGGRRHGPCPITLRPCAPTPAVAGWPAWGHGYVPVRSDGVWLNVCGHRTSCGCESVHGLRLDAGPLSAVSAVRVDGAAVPPWAPETGTGWLYAAGVLYRLQEGATLAWPARQRLELPDSQPETFAVDVLAGLEVDELGLLAAGILACELLKGLRGDEKCRLPSSLVGLVRQGVSMTFSDPSAVLAERRTGLTVPDYWINAVNPERLARAPGVYSPDRMPRRG